MHIVCSEDTEDGIQVWSYVTRPRSPVTSSADYVFPHQVRSKSYVVTHNPCKLTRQLITGSPQDALFTDYRIQSKANNEINISISPDALLQVLRSASSSDDIIMKLAKKHGRAVLCFDIALTFGGGGLSAFGGTGSKKARIEHNVLIEVLRPVDMAKLKEPLCPEPDVRAQRSLS